jgi:GABA permease
MAKRILALTSAPINAEVLKSAIGEETAENAEVLVIAPALNSKMRFWTGDADEAIGRADEIQEESVERLAEEGVDAAGDTGESDPLLAIQDSLATYEADEIVLFTHSQAESNWLEEGIVDQAKERFEVPVRHLVIE